MIPLLRVFVGTGGERLAFFQAPTCIEYRFVVGGADLTTLLVHLDGKTMVSMTRVNMTSGLWVQGVTERA